MIEFRAVPCPVCSGSGSAAAGGPCDACDGTGRIAIRERAARSGSIIKAWIWVSIIFVAAVLLVIWISRT